MKNILLFSTGLSPQVVTESLYYHTQIKKKKIDSIHIITDNTGLKLMDNLFLWYNKFLKEYKIKNQINFSKKNINILKGKNNKPLDDLKTIDDNDAATEQIFKVIEKLTNNDNSKLIVSVAGGRKTMSVIIGQALQFYAREYDQLTHVIVDDYIVGCPDFYYPTKKSNKISYKNKTFNAKNVNIYLDQIPFIKLRNITKSIIPKKNQSFTSLISVAQEEIDSIEHKIKIEITKNQDILINNKKIVLPNKPKAIYILFLKYAKKTYKNKEYSISIDDLLEKETLDKYYKIYSALNKKKSVLTENEKITIDNTKLRNSSYTSAWAQETRSKINRKLNEQLNPHEFALCRIASSGERNSTRYGISINPKNIHLKNQA